MRLKRIIDNESGLTYTIEAVLGLSLILGSLIFVTGNMPYAAENTEEHSKVQLMNIGRDTLDLLSVTPATEIETKWNKSKGYRNYTLLANDTFDIFVMPWQNVNFTVRNMTTNEILYINLIPGLEQTVLGKKDVLNRTPINGYIILNFSTVGDYNFRAYACSDPTDNNCPENPTNWSNYVTVRVGYYYLDSDIDGVYEDGDKNVYGVVYNSSDFGISGLKIEILDSDKRCYPDPNDPCITYNITTPGRIIEDFENGTIWNISAPSGKSNRDLSLNTTYITNGTYSLNLSHQTGTSDFWVEIYNNTLYGLKYYEILSFDFFAITGTEKIDVTLINDTTRNKSYWFNISGLISNSWNKINIKLKYPDKNDSGWIASDVDTINISVKGASALDYYIDNLSAGNGNFSFMWPPGTATGVYYIRANDSSGNTSNLHRLIYSESHGGGSGGWIYADRYIIEEGDTTKIHLKNNSNFDFSNLNTFKINLICYMDWDVNKATIEHDINDPNYTTINFTGRTAGDYYIFYGTSQGCGGNGGNPERANAIKTNGIVITVIAPVPGSVTDELCALDSSLLNQYIRSFVPPYINYNLYLVNPDGTICKDCPKFKDGEIINGYPAYPTSEAVAVGKPLYITSFDPNKTGLGFVRELRMVLWYK